MGESPPHTSELEQRHLTGLLHRETLVLVVLTTVTLLLFFVTRAVAEHDRHVAARTAAAWYAAGTRALEHGDNEHAIGVLRRAALNAPTNIPYLMKLSEALAAGRRSSEAQQVLLQARESAPENGDINLALGRLAAQRDDAPEAVRFYHHALYGIWPGLHEIDVVRMQRIRAELVGFLLTHHQPSQALAETLLLEEQMPDDRASHLEMGRLFMNAGSATHALVHFAKVLEEDPSDRSALAGAARAAFDIGDYSRARRHLMALRAGSAPLPPDISDVARITDLMVGLDPLAPRLSAVERADRLSRLERHASARVEQCGTRQPGTSATGNWQAAEHLTSVTAAAIRHDPEIVRADFDRLIRLERSAERCGPEEPMDRVMFLLERKYMDAEK